MLGVLGIDVSKEQLKTALWDKQEERFRWEKGFRRDAAGVCALLKATPPEVPWVLEPTGRYSLFVAKMAQEAGRSVLLASSRSAKQYLESLHPRAKTDRLDSQGLAHYAATRPRTKPLPPYPIKSEPVEHLDQLLQARKGLALALMKLRQQAKELPYAQEVLASAIADLEQRQKVADRQIAALAGEYPEVKKLQAVPGIGPVVSAAMVSRLKARGFGHPDQFVAYVGLDVRTLDSGQRKGKRGLSKHGDAELRRLLFLAARSSLTAKNSPFKAQYQRELAKGMSKTAAACAVARKLARLCWSMVKHGTKYDAARV